MDILLSPEEKAFKEYCRNFAKGKLIRIAEKYGETADIPRELVEAMAGAGFSNFSFRKNWGERGQGLTHLFSQRAIGGGLLPCGCDVGHAGTGQLPHSLRRK